MDQPIRSRHEEHRATTTVRTAATARGRPEVIADRPCGGHLGLVFAFCHFPPPDPPVRLATKPGRICRRHQKGCSRRNPAAPAASARFDQEGELALVIGRTARHVSEQEALSHVFGYTGLLDITMPGRQEGSMRKSFDTFASMGPVLVTADEFGDPGEVELRCWVSGQLRERLDPRPDLGRGAACVLRIFGGHALPGVRDHHRHPVRRRADHGRRHRPARIVRARAQPHGSAGLRRHDRMTDRPQPRTRPATSRNQP